MPYASSSALSADSAFTGRPHRRTEPSQSRATILLALGIVYGDLGTSPLYTLQTIVHLMGKAFDVEAALGSLSLVFWSLIVTISVKYSLLVMRADNHGEGGILALMAMTGARWSGRGRWLLIAGLFGAALIYGDGIITPAISVLSAVEGLNVATAIFKPYTMPIALVILLGLFALQNRGSASVGKAFGPIMLLWFISIGGLGVFGIFRHPQVLVALDPSYGLRLLTTHGFLGFAMLGGVFLALTGGEALYADMGHVGRAPIRIAWYCIVLPALILNYVGQVATFIVSPDLDSNPFFKLAPSVALYPLVALATLATIIASQAIITGSFSMTRQAMQLGWFPGIRIRQTSADEYGQIYVPFVNWTMMVMTIALTAAFGTSDRLAGAYGTAVSTTMVLTTILLFEVTRRQWHWPLWQSGGIAAILLSVDLGFFAANLLKLFEGGWIPLTFGLLVFIVMITWHSGITTLHRRNAMHSETPVAFLARLTAEGIVRVPGTGVFLTRLGKGMPPIIVNYVRQTRSLFETVVALSVSFESTPRVRPADRIRCEKLGEGLWHMTVHFGFVEIPDLPSAISAARREGLPAWDRPTFYIERYDAVSRPKRPWLSRWRIALLAFMSRNSAHAVDRFRIPSRELVEIGRRIEL
ncbi:potassium transporter Kup [Bradyrhizobium erythrophlei]|uniref:Probable potassium transport system protein Kup n=1 Tax=Bradyrhizobium erythrophlei TaxID=1437360 RepID=A0A1H4Y2L1_9BRAD|nr:KUP/HAK/KT family potassium transporter [Bradyrhizobium erythrophlei]SED11610.1 KUP system potassium uptake protein [Bradyrhizobium erythrophlei]